MKRRGLLLTFLGRHVRDVLRAFDWFRFVQIVPVVMVSDLLLRCVGRLNGVDRNGRRQLTTLRTCHFEARPIPHRTLYHALPIGSIASLQWEPLWTLLLINVQHKALYGGEPSGAGVDANGFAWIRAKVSRPVDLPRPAAADALSIDLHEPTGTARILVVAEEEKLEADYQPAGEWGVPLYLHHTVLIGGDWGGEVRTGEVESALVESVPAARRAKSRDE